MSLGRNFHQGPGRLRLRQPGRRGPLGRPAAAGRAAHPVAAADRRGHRRRPAPVAAGRRWPGPWPTGWTGASRWSGSTWSGPCCSAAWPWPSRPTWPPCPCCTPWPCCSGIAETLFDTSAQSLLPAVVDRDDLTRANSRLFAVELVANTFVGPPLGGLLAAAGLAVALGLPAAAYLVGAGCLALLVGSFRAAGAGPAGSTRLRDDIAEGARFVWRHPVLRPLAIMLGVQNMAFAAAFAVFVLFAVAPGPMGLSEAGYGILTGHPRGRVAARHLAGRPGRAPPRPGPHPGRQRRPQRGQPGRARRHHQPGAGRGLDGGGRRGRIVLWNVVTVSLRQRITPDRLLGRMNAAYRLVGWGTMPLGAAARRRPGRGAGAAGHLPGRRRVHARRAGRVPLRHRGGHRAEAAEAAEAPTG